MCAGSASCICKNVIPKSKMLLANRHLISVEAFAKYKGSKTGALWYTKTPKLSFFICRNLKT